MRKLEYFLVLASLACSLLFAACSKSNEVNEVDPTTTTVTFTSLGDERIIEVDYEQRALSLPYTISNGIAGIDIVAEPSASWISDLKADGSNLTFSVTRNNSDQSRQAKITVKYPNVSDIVLLVKQGEFSAITFEMSITSQTSTSCTTLITPSNEDYVYIAYMSEIDYFLSLNITMAEELFRDDYEYFMGFAEQVNAPKLKEFFLMNYFAYQGEYSIDWTGMMPGKEYVLYVYAIEFNEANDDYWMASPVSYQIVTLENPALTEAAFDVNVEVNGPQVTYYIDPQNWDGKYYLTVYEEGDYMYRDENKPADENYAELVSSVWLDMMSQLLVSGYSADQLMEIMCLEGYEEYSELLKGSTNYAMVLYGVEMVDGLPQVATTPQVVNFRTEEIGASDMTIEIKVENNYVRVADITITPSTNEHYTVAIVATNEVPESSNKEIIDWLNDNFVMDSYSGEIFSHLNTLQPSTEYSILAYGYYGGVVTTDLFRYDFSTEAEGECENSVLRVEFDAPYSLKELEAYDSDLYYNYGMFEDMGWFAMWSQIFTETPSNDLFYCIYRADEFSIYGEEAILQDLVQYPCTTTQLLTGQNDTLYVMCAVCMDYRGNYSDMWVSEPFMYTYSATTKRPLEELLAKLNGSSTAAVSALAPNGARQGIKSDVSIVAKRK